MPAAIVLTIILQGPHINQVIIFLNNVSFTIFVINLRLNKKFFFLLKIILILIKLKYVKI